jgi:hypothetical protein
MHRDTTDVVLRETRFNDLHRIAVGNAYTVKPLNNVEVVVKKLGFVPGVIIETQGPRQAPKKIADPKKPVCHE